LWPRAPTRQQQLVGRPITRACRLRWPETACLCHVCGHAQGPGPWAGPLGSPLWRRPLEVYQLLKPTRSTSSLASLRCLAISVSDGESIVSSPKLATTGSSSTPFLTGDAEVALAYRLCALSETRYSSSLTASSRCGACFATAAPETFTCVPRLFSKVGRTTLMASPHLCASEPGSAFFIRPT